MKKIEIELIGVTPLLMNNPESMMRPKPPVVPGTKKYEPKKEAERLAYKNEKGELYIPSTAIKACMIGAASYKKAGKYALRPFIAGGIRICDSKISLGIKNYEIHTTTVVIKKNRVMKWRPMIKNWKVTFVMEYNPTLLPNPQEMIIDILDEAAERVGLLDWRPAKNGEFGQLYVNSWKEVKA